jgi:hypothetical protein
MRSREPGHVDGCGHLLQNVGLPLSELRTESQFLVPENKIRLHDNENHLMLFRKTVDSVCEDCTKRCAAKCRALNVAECGMCIYYSVRSG